MRFHDSYLRPLCRWIAFEKVIELNGEPSSVVIPAESYSQLHGFGILDRDPDCSHDPGHARSRVLDGVSGLAHYDSARLHFVGVVGFGGHGDEAVDHFAGAFDHCHAQDPHYSVFDVMVSNLWDLLERHVAHQCSS